MTARRDTPARDPDAGGDAEAEGDADSYVHEPDAAESDAATRPRNAAGTDPDREFDWRGWVLVSVVILAFLIVPGTLYLLPAVRGTVIGLGLGWRHTYLVLPLLPALLLGVVAVWAAVRSRMR